MKKEDNILKLLEIVTPIIPAPIYWENVDSILLGGNDAVIKGTGAMRHEAYVGKSLYELYPKDMAEHIKIHNEEVMRTGKVLAQEEAIEDITTGEFKYFTAIKAPLYDENGKIIGIVGTSIDITDRKLMEEDLKKAKETAELALQAMKQAQIEEQKHREEAERLAIDNTKHIAELKIARITAEKEHEMRKTVMVLVGDIVHDLYTPLAIIGDGAEILESISSGLNEVIEEANDLKSKKLNSINRKKLHYVINEMSAAQKYSVQMINDFIKTTLRELSVAQKYRDEPISREELTKCSSRRILENVLDSYPRRDNIKINECFPYDFFLMGNSILIMKVLFNLIRNAEEQIIANGKGEITITSEETEDKNLLIVKDTAGGAPPEVVENFFKEFFTTKKNGSGIGLASCKKIMHDLGGDLTCRSFFGESMEFILSFPKVDSVE